MHLAQTNLFRARWSADIHVEWMAAVTRTRPELGGRLERTRYLMNEAVEDCLVTGYEPLIEGLMLPDPKDRHVLAAAIAGRADVIVTLNLRDFPQWALAPYGIEAQHPDLFVHHVLNLDEAAALPAVRTHRTSLRSPAKSVEEFLDSLARQEMPDTVTFLRQRSNLI